MTPPCMISYINNIYDWQEEVKRDERLKNISLQARSAEHPADGNMELTDFESHSEAAVFKIRLSEELCGILQALRKKESREDLPL